MRWEGDKPTEKKNNRKALHNARLDEVPVHCGSHTQTSQYRVADAGCFFGPRERGVQHGFCERTCACCIEAGDVALFVGQNWMWMIRKLTLAADRRQTTVKNAE